MRALRIIWKIGQRYYKKSIYANFSAKKIHTAIYFANISWSAAGSWLPRNVVYVVYVVFLIKNVNLYCLSSALFLSLHLSRRHPEDTPKIPWRYPEDRRKKNGSFPTFISIHVLIHFNKVSYPEKVDIFSYIVLPNPKIFTTFAASST